MNSLFEPILVSTMLLLCSICCKLNPVTHLWFAIQDIYLVVKAIISTNHFCLLGEQICKSFASFSQHMLFIYYDIQNIQSKICDHATFLNIFSVQ